MINNAIKAVFFTAMVPFVVSAGDDFSPWYVGGGIGINNYEPNCDQKTMKTCGRDDPYAWDVFAGYLFSDYFGVEFGYRDLGHAEWVDYFNKLNDVGVKGMNLGLVGFWPLTDNWSLSAEAGAFNYQISNNKNYGSEYYSDSGIAPYIGAGIGYNVNENLKIQAKYRRYENLDEEKFSTLEMASNYWGLELSYRFGSKAKPVRIVAPVSLDDKDLDGVNSDNDQCLNTPSNYKVDIHGCTLYEENERLFNLDVKFDNNSSVIKKTSYEDIKNISEQIKSIANAQVVISGHASNTGTASYNMVLSEHRALNVANVLINKYGVESSSISFKGYGITQPIIKGRSLVANKANRRIEVLVISTEKTPVLK